MREVHIPFVRRHIGTFGQIAEIAQIALIDNFRIVSNIDTINFQGVAFVNQIKQHGERITQAYTAPAAMTDIIDALKLLIQILLVVKLFPVLI